MKKPKGIPDWFDIKKYSEAKTLTPIEWYTNLDKRLGFFNSMRVKTNPKSRSEKKEMANNYCNEIIEAIKINPLFHSDSESELLINKSTVKFREKRVDEHGFGPGLAELLSMAGDRYCEKTGDCKLTINLHANDKQIIADFKEWLKTIRYELDVSVNKKTPFSEKDLLEWAEYGVLPYLDLKIWSGFTGQKITQSVIGNTIYSDQIDVDTTERIRKTTKKKADWLMTRPVIDALGVQIKKNFELPLQPWMR